MGYSQSTTGGPSYLSFRSFAITTCIWSLLSMVAHTSVNASYTFNGWPQGYDDNYPIPAGDNVVRCVQGNDWQNPSHFGSSSYQNNFAASSFSATGQTSFTLPISAAALFFVSGGVNLGGSINVVTSTNQPANSATVQVAVRSTNQGALGATRACLLTRRQGEIGVGVFTPLNSGIFPGNWNSNFRITVVLPDLGSRGRGPLRIRDFETDLPNSSQQIGDLGRKVLFSRISLGGTNGAISANSLSANIGIISTTDAPIAGSYNTTNTLTLSTTNGPINVAVGLTSTGGNTRPTLKANTSNGPLVASVSLMSSSGSRGSFAVSARTANQHLQISFPTSPAGSQLILDASTSNSPATVSLNPLYTGGFNLRTSAFQDASVHNVHPELRERQVHVSNRGQGSSSGEVFWETGPNANGMVTVSTTNGNALLNV